MYLYRKAQRDREKEEELRIITEERNARNAELQRRIELRKLAKLKKKKQEEVPTQLFLNLSKMSREKLSNLEREKKSNLSELSKIGKNVKNGLNYQKY